jgi:hypothetical protein
VSCHQVGSPEPVRQRHTGSVHDRSGGHGRVVAAAFTPPQGSSRQDERNLMTASEGSGNQRFDE